MTFRAALLALSPLFLATPVMAGPTAVHRAVVADFTNGKLTVIDLMTGKAIAHFAVEGPARLKASENGNFAFVSQGAQNRVDLVDTGVKVEGHGDHLDVSAKPPRLLAGGVEGAKPSHVNLGGDNVAIFFDGEGLARVVSETKWAAGKATARTIRTAAPHHGLAAPIGDMMAMTVPHPSDAKQLPVGIEVLDADGKSLARSEQCPRLHGEAKVTGLAAFGCEDGVLFLKTDKATARFEKVAYPADLPTGRMVRNLAPGRQVASLLGDFGADGMVVIDPKTKGFSFLQLPARRTHFAREATLGDFGYAVTEDGLVHKINALTGKIEGTVQVTERYSMEGGAAVARPRISSSGDRVAVTDPAKALVHVIDTKTMKVVHSVGVPGAPFDIVVVGATGDSH
ncbi:MAG: hypothetical protein ACRC7G_03630 [Beijerinckiaceae bacterium]